jgi:hypothetical protein
MRGPLGVPNFFSKFFLNDVESTILKRSEKQMKENENFFKEKNVGYIIWEESIGMSNIIQIMMLFIIMTINYLYNNQRIYLQLTLTVPHISDAYVFLRCGFAKFMTS